MMHERYSPDAERVLFFARYEAGRAGALAIEPQHLLTGVQRVDRRLVKQFFATHPELEPVAEKKSFWQRLTQPRISTAVPLAPSPETKRALLYADEAVRQDDALKVTPEVLLAALLREREERQSADPA